MVMASQIDHLSQQAYRAIQRGDLTTLKELYKEERGIKVVDSLGNTTLHTAALCGNIPILKWLLKSSNLAILEKNYKGETCAHSAVYNGSLKLLRTVVYSGSVKPLTVASERDHDGVTILHLATVQGNTEVVNWLTETFGRTLTGLRNNQGKIALHLAAAKGHTKIVHILTRFGKQVANTKDRLGATPVFYAAKEGHLESLRFLLNSAKGDLRQGTDEGLTPLMVASFTGQVEVVRCLISLCKENDIMHQCHDGATAFHMAAGKGNGKVLEALLCHKASQEAIHIRDNNRNSPAHDAAQNGQKACLQPLLEHGLNPNQPNLSGDTPYTLALRSKSKECALYAKSLFTETSDSPQKQQVNCSHISGSNAAQSNLHRFKTIDDEWLRSQKEEEIIRPTSCSSSEDGSEISAPSRMRGEFILSDRPNTGRRRQNVSLAKDKILYKQPLRPRPLSLPFIEDDDIQSLLNETDRNHSHWRLFALDDETRVQSGESGYRSDEHKARARKYKPQSTNLMMKSRSYDDLQHSQHYGTPGKLLYKKSRQREEKETDYHLPGQPKRSKSADQYSSGKIAWTSRSTNNIDTSQHEGTEVSRLHSSPSQYSFLHSKQYHPNQSREDDHYNISKQSVHTNNTLERSLEREINPEQPNHYLQSVAQKVNVNELPTNDFSENYYSTHIPTVISQGQDAYSESVYYNEYDDLPLTPHRPSEDRRLLRTDGLSKRRPSGLPPPPLPPPRPESSQTLSMISSQRSGSDNQSVASSVPSDSPPNPVKGKSKAQKATASSTACPTPPLPLGSSTKSKPSSLADFITQNRLKLWKPGKKNQPKKPPRKHKKSKNFNQKHKKKNKISPKIEKMGKILEDAGGLVPFSDNKGNHYSENEEQINPPSVNNSRNTSPAARSNSPTSPREAAQKFSYLPSGIMLLNPKLRHIDRPSLRRARRDQKTRHDYANQKIMSQPAVDQTLDKNNSTEKPYIIGNDPVASENIYSKPRVKANQSENWTYKRSSVSDQITQIPDVQDGNGDSLSQLVDTLEAKLQKPFYIPLPDYNVAKTLEETDSPPSELEMFFKKRREQLDKQDRPLLHEDITDSEPDRSSNELQHSRLYKDAENVVRKHQVRDAVKRLSHMADDS